MRTETVSGSLSNVVQNSIEGKPIAIILVNIDEFMAWCAYGSQKLLCIKNVLKQTMCHASMLANAFEDESWKSRVQFWNIMAWMICILLDLQRLNEGIRNACQWNAAKELLYSTANCVI